MNCVISEEEFKNKYPQFVDAYRDLKDEETKISFRELLSINIKHKTPKNINSVDRISILRERAQIIQESAETMLEWANQLLSKIESNPKDLNLRDEYHVPNKLSDKISIHIKRSSANHKKNSVNRGKLHSELGNSDNINTSDVSDVSDVSDNNVLEVPKSVISPVVLKKKKIHIPTKEVLVN